jgi:hypothetical protein
MPGNGSLHPTARTRLRRRAIREGSGFFQPAIEFRPTLLSNNPDVQPAEAVLIWTATKPRRRNRTPRIAVRLKKRTSPSIV